MRLTALAIGTRMPAWVQDGVQTYLKRLPPHLDFSFREIPAAARGAGKSVEQSCDKEGEALLAAIETGAYVVALDERGREWTSAELARALERWMAESPRVNFMIGGADGLSAACKQRADRIWSLSALTLPHALVRVVLAEQIYRAWTLVQGHPYHRD